MDNQAAPQDEEINRRNAKNRKFEAELQAAADTPRRLKFLAELVEQAEELDRQDSLSPTGQASLKQARHVLEEGQKNHRQLTLLLRTGSLKDRKWVIDELKTLIADGETDILEAPSEMWRTAGQVLADGMREYQQESAHSANLVLKKAAASKKNNPEQAIKIIYYALDKNIPYLEEDRQRLEMVYLQYLSDVKKPGGENPGNDQTLSQEDLEGYRLVHDAYNHRLKNIINNSSAWLNQFFHSALSKNVSLLLAQAEAKETPVGKSAELIDMAETLARKLLENSIEIPEVLVRGAKILVNKNEPKLARDLLEKALPLYTTNQEDKIHRHSVTAWLLGSVEYTLGDHINGHKYWKEAHTLLTNLLTEARRTRQVEKSDWYQARLNDIDQLRAQTYEIVYFVWLSQFDTPQAPIWFVEFRKMMDNQFGQQKITELRSTIQLLIQEAARENNPEITWMAQVEAAFFEYQMVDYLSAINHLKQASIGYRYEHRYAVILWLLGMLQWWLPSQRPEAILNWEMSIHQFEELARKSDQTNQQSRRIWYETQVRLMKSSLKQWINLTKPG